MEAASIFSASFNIPVSDKITNFSNSNVNFCCRRRRRCNNRIDLSRRRVPPFKAINDISNAADPARVEVTWQIIVGSIAGVAPFVVAGIEFTKRIVAQRRCEVCGGSGLILREEDYFKCPGCGGFLPWQSWKRFFTG